MKALLRAFSVIIKLQSSQKFVSSSTFRRSNDHRPHTADMDSIKKKMEKLSNETREAENRIAHFESVKAANEAEAEKFEEQLRHGIMGSPEPN